MTDSSASPEPLASSPILAGQQLAFTGILASMTHAQAAELVAAHGGVATEHVSRSTTMLVVGEEGWPLEADGRPAAKLREAQRLIAGGIDLQIVNESDWLRILGVISESEQSHKLCTPAMLSRTLDLNVNVIRRWERIGLLHPVRKVHRLPYFDFRDVAGLNKLRTLLAAGVSLTELEASVRALARSLPHLSRPVERLELLAADFRLVTRDDHGPLLPKTGQRLFDFFDFDVQDGDAPNDEPEPISLPMSQAGDHHPERSASDWFAHACHLYDCENLEGAVEAFRAALMQGHGEPEFHFHLAEALYRSGEAAAALERFYCAVELDPEYVEAWIQIGCIHRELEEPERAIDAFGIALTLHEFPDAHFQLGETLAEVGRLDDARHHWREYLARESRGAWADSVRHRLEEIEHAR